MNDKEKKVLFAAVRVERARLPKDWNVSVSYDIDCLLAVVGTLQLALRHPQFKTKPTAQIIRHTIQHLIAGIPEDMPAMKELARLGDKPEYDA